jgi:hypothetical protein
MVCLARLVERWCMKEMTVRSQSWYRRVSTWPRGASCCSSEKLRGTLTSMISDSQSNIDHNIEHDSLDIKHII